MMKFWACSDGRETSVYLEYNGEVILHQRIKGVLSLEGVADALREWAHK